MPHCQTFHACLAIMMKTDARLLLPAFRRHSQTLLFRKHSGRSRTVVYFALVSNLSRASCCQTDCPSCVSHYWFPCSKQATHATDNSGLFHSFTVSRVLVKCQHGISWHLSVVMALPHRIQPEVQYTQSQHKFCFSNLTSYMLRLIYSHHQANRKNKDKMFTAAWEDWYLVPY